MGGGGRCTFLQGMFIRSEIQILDDSDAKI